LKKETIKVLIISTTNFDLDGITNVIMNYYRFMDKSNMQIDFVVPNDVEDSLKKEIQSNGSYLFKIEGRTTNVLSYILKLYNLIKLNKYDIVHAHGNSSTLALEMYSAKLGRARIRIPHSHNSTCKHKLAHRLFRPLFYYYYTNAFACGEKAGKWLFNDRPFEIIKNGIDLSKYKFNIEVRNEFRAKYKLNGSKVVGHIGHFSYQKNHEYLIDIFSELYFLDENYRLLLIGDGELKEHIVKKVERLGLLNAVIFTGKINNVHQLMQSIDMIVMPSRFEGLPLTLIEAQASCLPCFVSDVISREVAITDLISFIPLEDSPKEWAKQIHKAKFSNRVDIRDSNYNQIVDAGYSILDNAKKMKELFVSFTSQSEIKR
jgi:glycosyltransferase involved in cell wall biosynthesis